MIRHQLRRIAGLPLAARPVALAQLAGLPAGTLSPLDSARLALAIATSYAAPIGGLDEHGH